MSDPDVTVTNPAAISDYDMFADDRPIEPQADACSLENPESCESCT